MPGRHSPATQPRMNFMCRQAREDRRVSSSRHRVFGPVRACWLRSAHSRRNGHPAEPRSEQASTKPSSAGFGPQRSSSPRTVAAAEGTSRKQASIGKRALKAGLRPGGEDPRPAQVDIRDDRQDPASQEAVRARPRPCEDVNCGVHRNQLASGEEPSNRSPHRSGTETSPEVEEAR